MSFRTAIFFLLILFLLVGGLFLWADTDRAEALINFEFKSLYTDDLFETKKERRYKEVLEKKRKIDERNINIGKGFTTDKDILSYVLILREWNYREEKYRGDKLYIFTGKVKFNKDLTYRKRLSTKVYKSNHHGRFKTDIREIFRAGGTVNGVWDTLPDNHGWKEDVINCSGDVDYINTVDFHRSSKFCDAFPDSETKYCGNISDDISDTELIYIDANRFELRTENLSSGRTNVIVFTR